ncbi:hypothetical protein VZT92_025963 [Zoarces viviparus]|uniref:Uncharacterized protein n=1 Tax=Zoarces viviparus TaxID=48416 RepID=A0AAW1DYT0_ZOAVI
MTCPLQSLMTPSRCTHAWEKSSDSVHSALIKERSSVSIRPSTESQSRQNCCESRNSHILAPAVIRILFLPLN